MRTALFIQRHRAGQAIRSLFFIHLCELCVGGGNGKTKDEGCEGKKVEKANTDRFYRFVFTMTMYEHIPGGERCK